VAAGVSLSPFDRLCRFECFTLLHDWPFVNVPNTPPRLSFGLRVPTVTRQMMTQASRNLAAQMRVRAGSIAAIALLVAVLALVLTTTIRSPQKDDVAWLLYVARRWLAGQRLYEDLVEVNPPLIIWIYAVPAWVATWLHTTPKLIAIPFFASLVLASAWWSACLLHGRSALFARRTPIFAIIGIILLVLPGVEFGQREHLMTAAILPYLCAMAVWLDGGVMSRRTNLAVGILAGLGCALKPTYGLAFILPELLGLLRGRPLFRTQTLAAFFAALLYGIAVLVFCPAFLKHAVPLALALYGGTDTAMVDLLYAARVLLFGAGVVSLLWVTTHRQLAARSSFTANLYAILTTFAVGATVVYVLQGKDWFYHTIPAAMTTVLALILWAMEILPRARLAPLALPVRRLAPCAALAGVALFAFAATGLNRMRPWIEEAVEPELSTEVRLEKIIKHENARTYIAFSEWIGLGFPVVNDTGVVWTSRFDSMWALRGELWRARQDGRPPADWPIRRWIAHDFVRGCPDIAVVDARGGINFVAILVASDAAFAQAWTHYQQIAMFNGLRVLKRQGPTCSDANTRPRIAATALEAQ
jgi:hypothetical protein